MKFKVGQTVELINNSGMAAPLGATAIVVGGIVYGNCVNVVWKGNVRNQMNGNYKLSGFRALPVRGEQLLFSFMVGKDV